MLAQAGDNSRPRSAYAKQLAATKCHITEEDLSLAVLICYRIRRKDSRSTFRFSLSDLRPRTGRGTRVSCDSWRTKELQMACPFLGAAHGNIHLYLAASRFCETGRDSQYRVTGHFVRGVSRVLKHSLPGAA